MTHGMSVWGRGTTRGSNRRDTAFFLSSHQSSLPPLPYAFPRDHGKLEPSVPPSNLSPTNLKAFSYPSTLTSAPSLPIAMPHTTPASTSMPSIASLPSPLLVSPAIAALAQDKARRHLLVSDPSYRGQLSEGTEGLEGEVRGVVASRGGQETKKRV